MPPPDQCGDCLLEPPDQSPLYELSRFENGSDGALLIFANPRFR